MSIVVRPKPLALALSNIWGTCFPKPSTPVRWIPCQDCAKHFHQFGGVPRMTICRICDGSGRLAVMQ